MLKNLVRGKVFSIAWVSVHWISWSCFYFIDPLFLMLEFCSLGTLESNLRDGNKRKEMFMKKNRINLANEIAKGMEHLSDAKVYIPSYCNRCRKC